MADLDPIEEQFINGIIEKFSGQEFTNINDVNLENLRELLIPIFEAYQHGKITHVTFVYIADALENYIFLLGDGIYPELASSDPQFVGIEAIEYMNHMSSDFFIFPEDIPHFIDYLKTPRGSEKEAYQKIKKYISQFDYGERLKEAHNRGYIHYIQGR